MDTTNTTSALQALAVGSAEREEKLKPYLVERLWDQAAIYCGTYKKYNNGSLDGAWLELDMFDSYEEFLEICALLHDDEEDPEFMFQDFQGFPKEWYDESGLAESFDNIMEYSKLTDDEREIFDAYYEWSGNADFAHYKDHYMGKFNTEEDFAEYIVSECYDLDNMMGELSFYFDYTRYARDLFMSDYAFCDGYVFSNY